MQRKGEVIQKIFIVWPISNSGPPPHAVASCSSACLEPQQGAEAQRRKPPPSERQDTWGMSGMSYLIGLCTGVGGWGKLRAQTRAEAGGAEMKILTSKDRRRALLIKLRNP